MTPAAEEYLDCSGESCPIPIVRISRFLKGMQPGQRLRVVVTDEAFPADLEAWLIGRAEKLISLEVHAGEQLALIEKGGEP